MNRIQTLHPRRQAPQIGLVLVLVGLVFAAPGEAETIGAVVYTAGKVCGWNEPAKKSCDESAIVLGPKSSIDRNMTVRTEEGDPIVCAMTIDKRVVSGGGAIIMRPQTVLQISKDVRSLFDEEIKLVQGVIRVVLPKKKDRKFGIEAGKALIVLHGTYVEIRVDRESGKTTLGVLEGWASVAGLVVPGAPPTTSLPEAPPEGAMRVRVYAGEQVDILEDGFISPPIPFPPDAPAFETDIIIEDEGVPTKPGMENPMLDPSLLCDLPRGVCDR